MLDLCHIEVPIVARIQACPRARNCPRVSALTPRTASRSDPAVRDASHRGDDLRRCSLRRPFERGNAPGFWD
jgi:hypothetical protein